MSRFLDDDFLLSTDTARSLFHDVAAVQPIVDLHTHLRAEDIATDRHYVDLSELWLAEDHYKWRAMRLAGVDEQLITGNAEPWDKFQAWAATVPRLVGSPLYVWTHLELRRVFGIDLPLSARTAAEIWAESNRQLPRWTTRRLLAHFAVRVVATTDDPGDDLAAHSRLREQTGASLSVVPTLRPDNAHRLLDDPPAWCTWADRLGARCGVAVEDVASLEAALVESYQRFADLGCRASDHGVTCVPDVPGDRRLADAAVRAVRQGRTATREERAALEVEVLSLAAQLAYEHDAVLQLHLGARRDVSPRLEVALGRDAGADAIDDVRQAPGLARFLGGLESKVRLSRTVLYNANPADNALFAAMAGAFSRPGVASLVQWGSPWWFNDHEEGLRRQLADLAQIGQLGGFVGMVADSRSPLSMTRHELFRRVLCDILGAHVQIGRIPSDQPWLAGVVRDVCTANAARFFGVADLVP